MQTKMNTKYVGHHVSSGGFVFYEDSTTKEIYVALLKDKNKNWWIPKGHVEGWESQVEAAFREIEEEMGIKKEKLEFVDFCHKDSYSYEENGGINTKEVYINIFYTREKFELSTDENDENLLEVKWYKFDEALEIIAFNKNELTLSKKIFLEKDCLNNVKTTKLWEIRRKLLSEKIVKYIECFIIYGSSVKNLNTSYAPADTDICIVLNDRDIDLELLSEFLYNNFEKPDFTIYFRDEIDSGLPFTDKGAGVFSLEYFSHGFSIYGQNIFKEKLLALDKNAYIESHLSKILEYILRIRNEYISKESSYQAKKRFINKYIIRILRSIFLSSGIANYEELQDLSREQLIEISIKKNIIPQNTVVNFDSLKEMFVLFENINRYVLDKYK